jgi:hypothetical protein
MFADRRLATQQGETMRLILKAGIPLLALTAMAVSAQAGKLETAAIGATPEGVDISRSSSPAAAERIHVPSAGERSFRTGEVIVSLPSNPSLEAIDALTRRHRLTRLESQSVGLLGKTVHRWGIADGRSIPDVILALKRDGGIDAQPNNVYTLQ